MCGKGGGSPPVPSAASTTFNSTVTPAPAAGAAYMDLLTRANALSATPFNPAMQGQVAAINPQQAGAGNFLYQLGLDMGNFDPIKVQSIMSPFTESVVGATQNWFNNQNAIQGNDLLSQAIRSGNAFGGDRAGVAQGILAGQQQLAQAPVIAGLRERGYTQALDEYNKLKQFGLTGAGAALGWGGMLQAQQQREFDVAQQNAMMASAYPFQTLNWYGSILGGIAPLLGQTAAGSNNPPTPGGAGIGAVGAGVGLIDAALGGGGGGPAPGGGGGKRGGVVEHFARGGLAGDDDDYGYAEGGSIYGGDDDDDEEDRASESKRESYAPPSRGSTYDLPETTATRPSAPNLGLGQMRSSGRQPPQPTFPSGMGGQQQQPKSELEGWLGVAQKAIPIATSLFALSDPKTKTDVQRIGRDDDGEPLYAFRYRGDPKTYPKVVGPMARPMAWGGYIPHLQDGGLADVMSDETPDPVLPGQQYARDYSGSTTWFNPRNERGGYTYTDEGGQNWTDTGAMRLREGAHASGLPSTTRGFATPGRSDLGNWFEVNAPGGRRTYAQKTDIGPPGVVDLNAPLASSLGFTPGNVSGRTYVRDLGRERPPEAGGTRWPDPSKGNVIPEGGLPSGEQPTTPAWQVPGARQGRAQAGPGVESGSSAERTGSTQPGLRRDIPELATPPKSFAQRWLSSPFTQFGAAMMAGKSPWVAQNIGTALMSTMAAQNQQRREELLDAKPHIFEHNGQQYARVGSKVFDLGLGVSSKETRAGAAERRAEEAEKRAEEEHRRRITQPYKVGTEREPGLFGEERDVYETYDPTTGERRRHYPVGQQPQQTPQPETPQVAPPPAPPVPPPAQPTPEQPAPPTSERPIRQTQGPTGTIAGDLARPLEDRLAAAEAAEAGTAVPPTIATPAPTMQTAQAGTPEAGPTPEAVENEWKTGRVAPAGTMTNPAALRGGRNEAVLQGLSPEEQQYIKDIVDYKRNPTTIPAKNRERVMGYAQNYDPNYNQAMFATRSAALRNFHATGPEARVLQSQDMVMQHIGRGMDNVEKLAPYLTGYSWINRAQTQQQELFWRDPKRQAALRALETNYDAIATEAMRVFRGGVGAGSQREIEEWRAKISPLDPIEKQRAALKEITEMVYGRIASTGARYNDAMGPGYERPPESWLSPKARDALDRALRIDPARPVPPSGTQRQEQGPSGGQQGMPARVRQGGHTFERQPDGSYKAID